MWISVQKKSSRWSWSTVKWKVPLFGSTLFDLRLIILLFKMNSFKFRYKWLVCVYVSVRASMAFHIIKMKICWILHLSCSVSLNLQLNVRNKSAAAECYMRTEACLEGFVNSMISILHFLYISLKSLPFPTSGLSI